MNWRILIGSGILAAALLFNLGAPVIPVVLGLSLGGLLTWSRQRRPGAADRKT